MSVKSEKVSITLELPDDISIIRNKNMIIKQIVDIANRDFKITFKGYNGPLAVLHDYHAWLCSNSTKVVKEVNPEKVSVKHNGVETIYKNNETVDTFNEGMIFDAFIKKWTPNIGPLHKEEPSAIFKSVISNHPILSKCKIELVEDHINNKTTNRDILEP